MGTLSQEKKLKSLSLLTFFQRHKSVTVRNGRNWTRTSDPIDVNDVL